MKKLITVAILALSLTGLAQETPKETKREKSVLAFFNEVAISTNFSSGKLLVQI